MSQAQGRPKGTTQNTCVIALLAQLKETENAVWADDNFKYGVITGMKLALSVVRTAHYVRGEKK